MHQGIFSSANATASVLLGATQHKHMFHVSRKSGTTCLTYEFYCNCLASVAKANVPWRSHTWNTCLIKLLQLKPTALLEALQKKILDTCCPNSLVYAPDSTSRSLTPVKLPSSFLVTKDVPESHAWPGSLIHQICKGF